MRKIITGIGIIGCGAVSRLHIKSYSEMEDVRIKAVADINPESAYRTGHEYGVDFYEDYKKLLEHKDIHVVSVCTPNGLHEEATLAAARAGKHIIVEKPLEINTLKIDNMIRECEANGVRLAAIFNNRYREGNIFLKKALTSGRFGKIINANCFVRWYRDEDYYLKSKWRGTWALDGGGALINQSIHYIDLLLWFIGRINSVFAYTGALLHKTIEAEDTAAVAFEAECGAIGAIVAATSVYPGFSARLELTGERGSASICDGTIDTWSFRDDDALDIEANAYRNIGVDNRRAADPMGFAHTYHKKQLTQIIDAFRHGRNAEVNGMEARRSVELINAIYESARQRKEIRL